jgi:hypothetical protein
MKTVKNITTRSGQAIGGQESQKRHLKMLTFKTIRHIVLSSVSVTFNSITQRNAEQCSSKTFLPAINPFID